MQVKNISGQTLFLPNIGKVEDGETVTVPDGFNNANFEVVKSGGKQTETKKVNKK